MPKICTCLTGLVFPEIILTAFFFTSNFFAKNSIRHWFAFPFSGGAATLIFNISPSKPLIRVGELLPGTIFTAKTIPSSNFSIAKEVINEIVTAGMNIKKKILRAHYSIFFMRLVPMVLLYLFRPTLLFLILYCMFCPGRNYLFVCILQSFCQIKFLIIFFQYRVSFKRIVHFSLKFKNFASS